MLIRDLESKTGMDRATIRFYEKEGLIQPERKNNGYRTYSEQDCETLLKIKLLRQLKMPLEKINNLQQGREALHIVLSEQIALLKKKQGELNRAIDVCAEMYGAHVSYDTLDSVYYLNRLNRAVLNATPAISRTFAEPIRREYHPVRRYIARTLDYCILDCLLLFLFVVIFRFRIPGSWFLNLISYAKFFLMVPIQAWMLHKFGTTPGKWCMGLRVESVDGGLLSYDEAFDREKTVLSRGMGYAVPIYTMWRMYKSYKSYGDDDLVWDRESEYVYQKPKQPQMAASVWAIIMIIVSVGWFVCELMVPRYRGDLTISNFADNYNYYLSVFLDDADDGLKLRDDGSLYPISPNTVMVYVDAQPEIEQCDFRYETEGEYLQRIKYTNSWTDVSYFTPLGYQCQNAALTAVMSQKGMDVTDIIAFLSLWDKEKSNTNGHIVYGNVEISWDIEAPNCVVTEYGMYFKENEDEENYLSMHFEITFHGEFQNSDEN